MDFEDEDDDEFDEDSQVLDFVAECVQLKSIQKCEINYHGKIEESGSDILKMIGQMKGLEQLKIKTEAYNAKEQRTLDLKLKDRVLLQRNLENLCSRNAKCDIISEIQKVI